jgi:hypothetical protein
MQTLAAPAEAAAGLEKPASKPMPGTDAYVALVRQARAYLLSVRHAPTIEAVASYLDERPEDVRQTFALIEEQDLAARRARPPRHQRRGAGAVPAVPAGARAAAQQMASGA